MKPFLILLCALWVTGCQPIDPLSAKNDPKSPWWELGFTEPRYMKVWVEDTSVEDIKGRTFLHTGGGSASGGQPEDGTESARGWHGLGSSAKAVVGADLPKRIFVRWQSIVEPQTYRAWIDIGGSGRRIVGADLPVRIWVRWQSIAEQKTWQAWVDIPEQARQLMVQSVNQRCPQAPDQEARSMASVYLGLAPGGVVQVWVRDSCNHPVKVARGQAEIEPLPIYLSVSMSAGNQLQSRKPGRRGSISPRKPDKLW
ncbi:DUF2931 family protein [Pseudomonas sp. 18058]|uniref:DUF2931 family protein n=1 Tax=Pseudomonas sp. 18058 TaxID=2681406 RepID=UPI001358FEC1|nr:DUF2931 family protein [Pseudomonas sp. 18058]